MKTAHCFLILCILLATGSFARSEDKAGEVAFFDRSIFLKEDKQSGKSFSGAVINKSGVLYLVVCRHSVARSVKRIMFSLPTIPSRSGLLQGTSVSHSKADLAVYVDPFDQATKELIKNYALPFNQLAKQVPPKLTPVVVSGYPTRLVTEPRVSPVVRLTSVSSIETMSKSGSESIPVFFLNDFAGMGSSGSPVFDYRDNTLSQPKCIGFLAGGWNSSSNTGSVVTPAYYLRELIEKVERDAQDSKK